MNDFGQIFRRFGFRKVRRNLYRKHSRSGVIHIELSHISDRYKLKITHSIGSYERTLYHLTGLKPSDEDVLVGILRNVVNNW